MGEIFSGAPARVFTGHVEINSTGIWMLTSCFLDEMIWCYIPDAVADPPMKKIGFSKGKITGLPFPLRKMNSY